MLGSKGPSTETGVKEDPLYTDINISAAIKGRKCLPGLGEISIPRQEAVELSPGAIHEWMRAQPPYAHFLLPELTGDP